MTEEGGAPVLLVDIVARANSWLKCSKCGKLCRGYDTLSPRRFEFVPLWGIKVFFVYVMRRCDCPDCGVVVEAVPWAEGKQQLTTTYAWFLADWAKRMSWKEVARAFKTSWDHVFQAVEMAVLWGLEHRDLKAITAIGVDEVQWQHGQKYLTVVYQINKECKRLLWVGCDRTEETLKEFFTSFGKKRSKALKFICSDMWKPYITVIAEKASRALHVLDRYHIVAKMNTALDEVRAAESKDLKDKGYEPVLKKTRWCLLKRPENLTEKQGTALADLLRYNLKSVRAYLLKEEFCFFWEYIYPASARKYLLEWCNKAMRSRIKPMKKIAKMLRAHQRQILNWFKARDVISLGAVEGLNNKEKLVTRKAYGFRTYKAIEVALYHTLGVLPELKTTHRFC
jgi:transposase